LWASPESWNRSGPHTVVVSDYKPIQNRFNTRVPGFAIRHLPRAFTLDIETLALPGFRDRVGQNWKKDLKLGYIADFEASRDTWKTLPEEERVYQLGSLTLRPPRPVNRRARRADSRF